MSDNVRRNGAQQSALNEDLRLDALIEGSLPELPPEDVARDVSPWRKSMGRVLTGMVLVTFTLNILLLQYILPAAGAVLMLLGYRQLRRENGWFGLCYGLSWISLLRTFAALVLNATIYSGVLSSGAAGLDALKDPLTLVTVILSLLHYFAFYKGFRSVQKKAGTDDGGILKLLIAWYVALIALALIGAGGWFLFLVMIALYVLVIKAVAALMQELDTAGYCIRPAPVRIADRTLTYGLLGILAAGMICGAVSFSRLPMKWSPVSEARGEAAASRERLVELGLPEDLAADLGEDILLAMADAAEVLPAGERSYEVKKDVPSAASANTAASKPYPQLRCRNYAVRLGEGERWMLIHGFEWPDEVPLYGTSAIRINSGRREFPAKKAYGRLLYEKNAQSFAAPAYGIGISSMPAHEVNLIDAEFSLPKKALSRRGYVAYEVEASRYFEDYLKELAEGTDRYYINSYAFLRFRTGAAPYPFRRASAVFSENGFVDIGLSKGYFNCNDELEAQVPLK